MEPKKNDLFRERSLEKISSPEELDKYIKTASPTVVILFVSIILFLTGLITWGFVGYVETKTSPIGFYVENGTVTSYISEADYEEYIYEKDQTYLDNIYLTFNDVKMKLGKYSDFVYQANELCDIDLLNGANIAFGEWYYEITTTTDSNLNGHFTGKIVYETAHPISFLF